MIRYGVNGILRVGARGLHTANEGVTRTEVLKARLPVSEALPAKKEETNEQDTAGLKDVVHESPWPRAHLLPSPFFDKDTMTANLRHRTTKSQPPPTPQSKAFHTSLEKNPFAQALATPVRVCAVTGACLPRYFLLDFGLMAHPRTGEPWLMPRGLSRKYAEKAAKINVEEKQIKDSRTEIEKSDLVVLEKDLIKMDEASDQESVAQDFTEINLNIDVLDTAVIGAIKSSRKDETEMTGGGGQLSIDLPHNICDPTGFDPEVGISAEAWDSTHDTGDLSESQSSTDQGVGSAVSTQVAQKESAIGPSSYLLCRHQLLEEFNGSRKMSTYKDGWKKMMAANMFDNPNSRAVAHKARWRSDMDSLILELLRRRVRENLEHLYALKRGYLSPALNLDLAVLPKRQGRSILWMGPPPANILDPASLAAPQMRVPEFAIFSSPSSPQHKLPIFNLRRLLGKQHCDILRNRSEEADVVASSKTIFDGEWILLKNKKMCLAANLMLWRLEGFLATHPEFVEALSESKSHSSRPLTWTRHLPLYKENVH